MANRSRVTVFKPIDSADFSITPFKAHKNYYLDQGNVSASFGGEVFVGYSVTDNKIPIGASDASTYATTSLGLYQQVIHNSIDNMYYARANKPYERYGIDDIFLTSRHLAERVNVVSIPQRHYGEEIQPGTVYILDSSRSGSYGTIETITLRDDGNESLRDGDVNTGSFASSSALVVYWGFNEFYKSKGRQFTGFTNHVKEGLLNKHPALINRVHFGDGITTTGDVNESSGLQARFITTGSMMVKNHDDLNFRYNKDFAISFWMRASYTQDYITDRFGSIFTHNSIIVKDGQGTHTKYSTQDGLSYLEDVKSEGHYPYKIELINHRNSVAGDRGKLVFSRNDTINTPTVTSSAAVFPQLGGDQHHILCQRSSSYLQIWVDGILSSETPDTTEGDVHNVSDLWIGGNGVGDYFYSGSIDELRIYNETLPTETIQSLANNHYISSSAYQTNVAGNVFYSTGHMCITSNLPKYKYILTGNSGSLEYGSNSEFGFNLNYKGSHTIYENQAICKIGETDFNMTVNPTIRIDNDIDNNAIKDYATGSAFNPYITTVGLYNDKGQLLAIGKLGQPIKNPDNVNLNIIVRWDV